MATSILKSSLLGAGVVAALLGTTTVAMAGGFAIREQSAEYQGMSFAGNAAGGGGLSAMFWNPAAVAQFDGIRTESHYSLIIPQSELTALAGSTLIAVPGLATSTDIGKSALVPGSYLSYRLNNWASLGFSLNTLVTLGAICLALGTAAWTFQEPLEPVLESLSDALRSPDTR